MIRFFFIILCFFLSSCGYHFRGNYKPQIAIDYVKNDFDGRLTANLINQLSINGNFKYVLKNADYHLCVKTLSSHEKPIGFMHDRSNDGEEKKNIKPTEGRETLLIEMSVMNDMGKVVIGPMQLEAFEDFDYIQQDSLRELTFIDNNNQRQSVLNFSLGQLEANESAKMAAKKPLFEKISKKIVEILAAYL